MGEKWASFFLNGAAPAAQAAASRLGAPPSDEAEEDSDDGQEDDEEDASEEGDESQRARVLAFFRSQPEGKRVPLLFAIEKQPDISEKSVRSYTSKFAMPGGPLRRVRLGVYRYVGESEE